MTHIQILRVVPFFVLFFFNIEILTMSTKFYEEWKKKLKYQKKKTQQHIPD